MWPRRPDAAQCAEVGQMAARLHRAGGGFPLHRRNALSVAGWRPLYEAAASRADEVVPGLREHPGARTQFPGAAFSERLAGRRDPCRSLSRQCLLSRASVCSGIIDFYFACNDAFAYEIADLPQRLVLRAGCVVQYDEGHGAARRLRARAPLERAEREALPILARGAALRFLLTRLVDWLNVPPGALVKPKDPIEYMRKLRFHQKVGSAREFGLAA